MSRQLTPQFIGMSLVDKVGRRRLMLMFVPGMMIALVWAIISFHCELAAVQALQNLD